MTVLKNDNTLESACIQEIRSNIYETGTARPVTVDIYVTNPFFSEWIDGISYVEGLEIGSFIKIDRSVKVTLDD